ncbi:MAG: hypothetical protein WCI77_08070 [Candidatus Omnitrophota bacterium]
MSQLNLNCAACNDFQKIDRGCNKDSPIPDKWQIGEIKFQRCPKKIVNYEVNIYFQAYRRFQQGFLPNSGGWIEQPAKFNDIIDILEAEFDAIEQESRSKNDK